MTTRGKRAPRQVQIGCYCTSNAGRREKKRKQKERIGKERKRHNGLNKYRRLCLRYILTAFIMSTLHTSYCNYCTSWDNQLTAILNMPLPGHLIGTCSEHDLDLVAPSHDSKCPYTCSMFVAFKIREAASKLFRSLSCSIALVRARLHLCKTVCPAADYKIAYSLVVDPGKVSI